MFLAYVVEQCLVPTLKQAAENATQVPVIPLSVESWRYLGRCGYWGGLASLKPQLQATAAA